MVTWMFAMLAADAALAQDALLVSGKFYSASRSFGRELGPGPLVRQQDIFGGGHYAVVGDQVVDGRTGTQTPVSGRILAVDPARPRIFVLRTSGVWMVEVSSGAEVAQWTGNWMLVRYCALAYSSNELFCGLQRSDGLTDVVVINVSLTLGTTIATIEAAPRMLFGDDAAWSVTSDGRRLYFGQDASPFGTRLAVLNTITGAVATSTVRGAPIRLGLPPLRLDELNERVYVIAERDISVLSADLALLATGTVGGRCNNLAISPHTGRLYLGRWDDDIGAGGALTLRALDASTYAVLASPVVPGGSKDILCPYIAVLTPPAAPKHLTGTAVGSEVTLTWTNVGGASSFVLDVGFAPGRYDLHVPLGPDARVTFPNVPSGAYYLRVRGGNAFGGGNPSSEIRLAVP